MAMADHDEVSVMNPRESGQTATFGWGGKFQEIAPGEGKLLPVYLANHARKHNPFLVVLDSETDASKFAEAQVNLAKAALERETAVLEAQAEAVRRKKKLLQDAQRELDGHEKIAADKAQEQANAEAAARQAQIDAQAKAEKDRLRHAEEAEKRAQAEKAAGKKGPTAV